MVAPVNRDRATVPLPTITICSVTNQTYLSKLTDQSVVNIFTTDWSVSFDKYVWIVIPL